MNMNDPKTTETADMLYRELTGKGLDVLMDDREERAGVKFKDADLIGIPTQIIIGEKNLREGLLEIKDRKTKETLRLKVDEVAERL